MLYKLTTRGLGICVTVHSRRDSQVHLLFRSLGSTIGGHLTAFALLMVPCSMLSQTSNFILSVCNQNLVFDADTNSVLRAEMAKKNLFVKRGILFLSKFFEVRTLRIRGLTTAFPTRAYPFCLTLLQCSTSIICL